MILWAHVFLSKRYLRKILKRSLLLERLKVKPNLKRICPLDTSALGGFGKGEAARILLIASLSRKVNPLELETLSFSSLPFALSVTVSMVVRRLTPYTLRYGSRLW